MSKVSHIKVSHIITTHPDLVVRRQRLREYYIDQRGADLVGGVLVPRTTGSDVKQLATAWSAEVAKVTPRDADDRRQIRRWAACMNQIAAHAAELEAVYPFNEEFWQRCTARLAIWLNARKVVPSRWSLVLDAATESLTELPKTLADTGGSVAGWVGDKLDATGTMGKQALLVGGVVLGAAVLIPPLVRAVRS